MSLSRPHGLYQSSSIVALLHSVSERRVSLYARSSSGTPIRYYSTACVDSASQCLTVMVDPLPDLVYLGQVPGRGCESE